MINDVQQQVDSYETMGLAKLRQMQAVNPKLVAGIALQNLETQIAAQENNKNMQGGMAGIPTVLDRKLGATQGQQQAAATASPGLQMRGKQMEIAQNRQMMGIPAGGALPMANGGIVGYAEGGPTQSAMLTETQKYLDAQRTLNDPNASQQEKVFAKGILNSLRPVQQGGNVDPNIYAQMQQQLEKIRAARAGEKPANSMAGGGIIGYERGGEVNMDSLLNALMIAESGGNPRAISSAGAEGAYQIMPSTAAQPGFGVKPMEGSRFDPEASRKFARQYLQAMIDRYGGDIETALVAYNAGAGNADKFIAAGKDYKVLPRAMQTQPYVDKIMGQIEKEGRRRDIKLGGGRTISTTAPESYTERMQRERDARIRAIETGRMPPRPPAETEVYQPNIPDALTIARAQQELREPGSTSSKYTREEKDAGGIGYLNYLARKQQEKKDEASRAARYMKMMGNQEDIIRRANPAVGLAGIDTNQEFTTERSMKSPAQRLEEAFPGIGRVAARYAMSKNTPEAAAARIDERPQSTRSRNPFVNLKSDLGELGSYLRDVLGFQEGGEVKKYAGEDESLVEMDRVYRDESGLNVPVPSSRVRELGREPRDVAGKSAEELFLEGTLGKTYVAPAERERRLEKLIEERLKRDVKKEESPEKTFWQRLMELPKVEREERQPRQERREEGILSRLGSAATSPRALAIADALSKLSYAGGATEGYMGRALRSGLQAEEQAREKLRLEKEAIEADKLRSEATLEAARQAQQAKLMADFANELGKYEASPTFREDLNARMEAKGEDRETAIRAIKDAKIKELMSILTGQRGFSQMPGLGSSVTPEDFAAAQAYLDAQA